MKSYFLATVVVLAAVVAGCTNKVDSPPADTGEFYDDDYFQTSADTAVTGRASDVTFYSALLTGKLNIRSFSALPQFSTWGMVLSASDETPTLGADGCVEVVSKRKTKIFTCTAPALAMGTRYYYRAFLREGRNKVDRYGRVMCFTTQRCDVTTSEATPVSIFSAVLRGESSVKLNDTRFKGEVGFLYTSRQTDRPNASVDSFVSGKVSEGDSIRFEAELANLAPATRYLFQAYMKIDTAYYWGEVRSFTTSRLEIADGDKPVDLGLSALWAARNVGAQSAASAGTYFGWGDPTGEKTTPDPAAYPSDASIVATANDMATANMGVGWQLPTFEQVKELMEECDWAWTTYDGVQGYAVVSRTNGAAIFLPAAGYAKPGADGRTIVAQDIAEPLGFYWTGSLSSVSRYAYYLSFSNKAVDRNNLEFDKSYGFCARAVLAQ